MTIEQRAKYPTLCEAASTLRKWRLIYHQLSPRERVGMTIERLKDLAA